MLIFYVYYFNVDEYRHIHHRQAFFSISFIQSKKNFALIKNFNIFKIIVIGTPKNFVNLIITK